MQILIDKATATSLVQQRMREGEELAASINRQSDASGWAAKLEHSLERIMGDDQWIAKFKHRIGSVSSSDPFRNMELARDNVSKTVKKLHSLIDIIDESDDVAIDVAPYVDKAITNRVFLVHGRADAPKNEVARFLEQLGLQVIILHERPNLGRTLISKFQEESADVSFAVVLVTGDDAGGLAGDAAKPRARQNVVFELGFFIGRLGPDRVCALVADGVETPSDYDGVAFVPLDLSGGWKNTLTRELVAAKVPVDFSKAFGS
ncbi:TIR domain-containing protein [Brevundimonas sp. Marseille-Q4549]